MFSRETGNGSYKIWTHSKYEMLMFKHKYGITFRRNLIGTYVSRMFKETYDKITNEHN